MGRTISVAFGIVYYVKDLSRESHSKVFNPRDRSNFKETRAA